MLTATDHGTYNFPHSKVVLKARALTLLVQALPRPLLDELSLANCDHSGSGHRGIMKRKSSRPAHQATALPTITKVERQLLKRRRDTSGPTSADMMTASNLNLTGSFNRTPSAAVALRHGGKGNC